MIKQNRHLWLGVTLRAKMAPQQGKWYDSIPPIL
jgi:hypothetical protein